MLVREIRICSCILVVVGWAKALGHSKGTALWIAFRDSNSPVGVFTLAVVVFDFMPCRETWSLDLFPFQSSSSSISVEILRVVAKPLLPWESTVVTDGLRDRAMRTAESGSGIRIV